MVRSTEGEGDREAHCVTMLRNDPTTFTLDALRLDLFRHARESLVRYEPSSSPRIFAASPAWVNGFGRRCVPGSRMPPCTMALRA